MILNGQGLVDQNQDSIIFVNPESSPIPKTLSYEEMKDSILSQLIFPEDFKKEGIVVIQFIVNINGKVETPIIKKGLDDRIENQILNLICNFEFIPGKFYGKEFPMYVNLPLRIISK